jgi:hypothetical protein
MKLKSQLPSEVGPGIAVIRSEHSLEIVECSKLKLQCCVFVTRRVHVTQAMFIHVLYLPHLHFCFLLPTLKQQPSHHCTLLNITMEDQDNQEDQQHVEAYRSSFRASNSTPAIFTWKDVPGVGQLPITDNPDHLEDFCHNLYYFQLSEQWLKHKGNSLTVPVFCHVLNISANKYETMAGYARLIIWNYKPDKCPISAPNKVFTLSTNDKEVRYHRHHLKRMLRNKFKDDFGSWNARDLEADSYRWIWFDMMLDTLLNNWLNDVHVFYRHYKKDRFGRCDQIISYGWTSSELGRLVWRRTGWLYRHTTKCPSGMDSPFSFPPKQVHCALAALNLGIFLHPKYLSEVQAENPDTDKFALVANIGELLEAAYIFIPNETENSEAEDSNSEVEDSDDEGGGEKAIYWTALVDAIQQFYHVEIAHEDDEEVPLNDQFALCWYNRCTHFGEQRYLPIENSRELHIALKGLRKCTYETHTLAVSRMMVELFVVRTACFYNFDLSSNLLM